MKNFLSPAPYFKKIEEGSISRHPDLLLKEAQLKKAARAGDIDTADKLIQEGIRGNTLFAPMNVNFMSLYTIILAGHPIPDNSSGYRSLVYIFDQGQNYWKEQIKLANSLVDHIKDKPEMMACALNALAGSGNLEAIKILLPPSTTQTQIEKIYRDHNDDLKSLNLIHRQNFPAKSIRGNHIDCMNYFLSLLTEKQWQQSNNNTPIPPFITTAAYYGQGEMIKLLAEKGCQINEIATPYNIHKKYPINPITTAIQNGNDHLISLLVELGCDVTNCQNSEDHPIRKAISAKADDETISYLVSLGADIHQANEEGLTPLAMAIAYNRRNIVGLLLKAGAEVNLPVFKKEFSYPVIMAAKTDDLDIFMMLREAGASLEVKDYMGHSTFDIISKRNGEISAFLQNETLNMSTPLAKKLKNKTARL